MKTLVVVFALVTTLLGQAVQTKDFPVTAVAGESWLSQLYRRFDETSMGKTGRLGPPTPGEVSLRWQLGLSPGFASQPVTLHGSDLYRLNCWGCHGESGLGAPPEINSVINPVRASSAVTIMERMNKMGMEMSWAEAAELAKQSKAALLQRLHNGGLDMPPFPHLSEADVRSLVAYLKQLAGIPGAEREQVAVKESPVRVGEHIVKSTCHICHSAAGPNPNPRQLLDGAIPPLNTLTMRMSQPEFVRKVTQGVPTIMGTPPVPRRGRMPVFYYLSEAEAADVYLYLTLYPPCRDQATAGPVSFGLDNERPQALQPSTGIVAFPLVVGLSVTLLLASGLVFTVREFRRLSAESEGCNVLMVGGGKVAMDVIRSGAREVVRQRAPAVEELLPSDSAVGWNGDRKSTSYSRSHGNGFFDFESTWLARRLENENWTDERRCA